MNGELLKQLFDQVQAGTAERDDPMFKAALLPIRGQMSDVYAAGFAYAAESGAGLDAADQVRRALLPGWRVNIIRQRNSMDYGERWEVELVQLGPDGWHKTGNLKSNVWHPRASCAWLLAELSALILCARHCGGERGMWRG